MAFIKARKVMKMGRAAEGSLEIRAVGQNALALTFSGDLSSDGKKAHDIVVVVDAKAFRALAAQGSRPLTGDETVNAASDGLTINAE